MLGMENLRLAFLESVATLTLIFVSLDGVKYQYAYCTFNAPFFHSLNVISAIKPRFSLSFASRSKHFSAWGEKESNCYLILLDEIYAFEHFCLIC